MLQTEFSFTLPCGYVDARGNLHRQGTMRLATALDEIEPLQDARVRANEAYLTILVLSRVVTRLGDLQPVDVRVIEGLFAADLAYLQQLYVQINEVGTTRFETQCPRCGLRFSLDLTEGGEADERSARL
jgi:hypothetical protein